jgi:protein SCO1/2
VKTSCALRRLAAVVLLLLAGELSVLAAEAPRVVVSGRPLHAIAAGLLAGVAEPLLLFPAGGDPRIREPSAADREALAAADLVVWAGPELEPALAPAIAAVEDAVPVYEALASPRLKVLPDRRDETRRDPFFWLDSRNMLLLLDELGRRLVELDPAHRASYERNWRELADALGDLDRSLEFDYRAVSGAPMFFYHDTHQYFAQAYAMNVAGTFTGYASDAGAGEALLSLRRALADADEPCLFTDRALPAANLELLVSGLDVRVVPLDVFGQGLEAGPGLYRTLMRDNFAALAGCTSGSGSDTAAAPAMDFPPEPEVDRFPPRVLPRYMLSDQYGRTITNQDFPGRLQLVFFGFTSCPDVCPTTLSVMTRAMKLLGDLADGVQPIFISVDPARDTAEQMKEYLGFFDPRIMGLRGSAEATKRTVELFRAQYRFVPTADGEDYTVDHTGSLYLLGTDGEFITKFAYGMTAAEVADRLRGYLTGETDLETLPLPDNAASGIFDRDR